MDGFVTHSCDVHEVNENAHCTKNELNQRKGDFSALKNGLTLKLTNDCGVGEMNIGKIAATVKETKGNHEKQNESYNTSSKNSFERANVENTGTPLGDERASGHNGHADEAKNNDGNGFNTSKESDVENDSGCDSSFHEIAGSESLAPGLRLSLKSLGVHEKENTAEKDWSENQDNRLSLTFSTFPSQNELSNNSIKNNASTESTYYNEKQYNPYEQHSQAQLFKKPEAEEGSFESLIQLAKEGMSDKAREVCEHDENKEIHSKGGTLSSNVYVKTVDSVSANHESIVGKTSGNTDREVKKPTDQHDIHDIRTHTNTSSDNTQSKQMACTTNTHQADSGVRLSSTYCILTIDDEANDVSLCGLKTGQSSIDGNSTKFADCVGSISSVGANRNSDTSGNRNKTEGHSGEFHSRKQKRVSFEAPHATNGRHAVACSNETNTLNCAETSDSFQETSGATTAKTKQTFLPIDGLTLPNKQYSQGDIKTKNDAAKENVENGWKATRTRLGSTAKTNVCSLKTPSSETFDASSQTSSDQGKRIRSFSATIRRKFSFRSRRSSDDMDVVGSHSADRNVAKNKKVKPFGSLRVNKKGKATSNDSRIWGLDSAEAKGYRPTFDEIFSEDTRSAVFSDVPFTIPEIND